jgi:hypothetical protein
MGRGDPETNIHTQTPATWICSRLMIREGGASYHTTYYINRCLRISVTPGAHQGGTDVALLRLSCRDFLRCPFSVILLVVIVALLFFSPPLPGLLLNSMKPLPNPSRAPVFRHFHFGNAHDFTVVSKERETFGFKITLPTYRLTYLCCARYSMNCKGFPTLLLSGMVLVLIFFFFFFFFLPFTRSVTKEKKPVGLSRLMRHSQPTVPPTVAVNQNIRIWIRLDSCGSCNTFNHPPPP